MTSGLTSPPASPSASSDEDAVLTHAAIPDVHISTTVNGTDVTASVPARLHVADFLRQHLALTGTHIGCEQGSCGMCTVVVDGEAVKSCLMLVGQLDGRSVQTVESLAVDDRLNPLQQSFKQAHALQCGFCTPGFLMTATALSYQGAARPSREQIREEIAGVLCRCTGYDNVVTAIENWFAQPAQLAAHNDTASDRGVER